MDITRSQKKPRIFIAPLRNLAPSGIKKLAENYQRYRQVNKTATLFGQHFSPVVANTDALKEEVFRLRYGVYCKEMKTEKANPSEIERDAYDDYAQHCLMRHNDSGLFAGTVRVITPQREDQLLPMEMHCQDGLTHDMLAPSNYPRQQISEISRLAVPKVFRRRMFTHVTDHPYLGRDQAAHSACAMVSVGLYFAAAALAIQIGMKHAYVMMEPRLAKSMGQVGVRFEQIGPLMEYHGQRAPYYINQARLEAKIKPGLGRMYKMLLERIGEQV
ncbi:MAG: PEP-CTERM/exosortase system-associated acyltransferase [Planctomycetes bacterium]|nr:PEP-CTERM/exosortase system-associated acyltransferase [Planctomycetota bacterium]